MKPLQPIHILLSAVFLLALTAYHSQNDLLHQSASVALFGVIAEVPDAPDENPLRLADDLRKAEVQKPITVDSETIWLARVIYSETKQPHEQELIAWVVRNRVETNYRGNSSYREAVLDPYQFSAFNPGDRKRAHYTSLEKNSRAAGWNQAIEIAHEVRHASPRNRPFSVTTRHFYSERSMVGRRHPGWANGHRALYSINRQHNIDERRFRFFDGIS